MKVYTRTGDRGQTSLIGGKRVSKSHERIEAYGTVDELLSYVGLLRDLIVTENEKRFLTRVQDRLMVCASILAADCGDCGYKIPEIGEDDIQELENEIDRMESDLEPISSFLLPGGHPVVSHCHIARTICRRAERKVVGLAEKFFVPEKVTRYINRLSDYLFVLSRMLGKNFNIKEIPWNSGL